MIGPLHPDAVLVTGVEGDPGGFACRVYIGARYEGRYFLISDPDARKAAEHAWHGSSQHVIADMRELAAIGVLLTDSRRGAVQ